MRKRVVLIVGALALAGCNGGTVDRHAQIAALQLFDGGAAAHTPDRTD